MPNKQLDDLGFEPVESVDKFDSIFSSTLEHEGGKTVDHAGATNYGITQTTLDNYAKKNKIPRKSVNDITPDEAKNIARQEYYISPKFDQLPTDTSAILFDFGYNAGPQVATKKLQETVGASPDGVIGPKTLKAVDDYVAKNGEKTLMQQIISKREQYNNGLVRKDPGKYGKFAKGWQSRINSIKQRFDLSALNPLAVIDAQAAEQPHPEEEPPSDNQNFNDLGFEDIGDMSDLGFSENKSDDHGIANIMFWPNAAKVFSKMGVDQKLYNNFNGYERKLIEGMSVDEREMIYGTPHIEQAIAKQKSNTDRGIAFASNAFDQLFLGALPESKVAQEASVNHPASAAVGAGAGTLANLAAISKVFSLTQLPKIAVEAGQAGAKFWPQSTRFIPRAIMTGTVFGTQGAVKEAIDQIQKDKVDPISLGSSVLESTSFGAFTGAIGGMKNVPLAVASAAGLGYGYSRAKGGDEFDNLISGAVNGAFEFMGGFGRDRALREQTIGYLNKSLADWAQAKKPGLSRPEAEAVASEFINTKANEYGGMDKVLSSKENSLDFLEKLNSNIRKAIETTSPKAKEGLASDQPPDNTVRGKDGKPIEINAITENQSKGGDSIEKIQGQSGQEKTMLNKQGADGEPKAPSTQENSFPSPEEADKHIDDVYEKGGVVTDISIDQNNNVVVKSEFPSVKESQSGYGVGRNREDLIPQPREPKYRLEKYTLLIDTFDGNDAKRSQINKLDVSDTVKAKLYQHYGLLDGQKVSESSQEYGKNPFYSQLERTIEDKMPNSATVDQVRGILKQPGIKQEEVDWADVEGFLQGKTKVSKSELLDHIRQNQVEIKEVENGGDVKKRKEFIENAFKEQGLELSKEMGGEIEVIDKNGESILPEELDEKYPELMTLANEYDLMFGDYSERPRNMTKFGQYQLPGGENYRELLLTLPPSTRQSIYKKTGVLEAYGEAKKHDFKSSHFEEPNILAHVRMNDRVDSDGKKVLFLEEVQSDWHQKGKKEGYKQPQKQVKELPAGYSIKEEISIENGVEYPTFFVMDPDGNFFTSRDYNKQSAINQALNRINQGVDSGVPDAPFKKTWHELALKRMLRYAAENGYDKLAWTTGEQQAERYDLSKQINEIKWNQDPRDQERDAGQKLVRLEPKTGALIRFSVDKNGLIGADPTSSFAPPDMFVGKNLSDAIGKDLAEKILGANEGSLSDAGLKVGGEGMKGFYDQILPSFMNKYAKKWGGRVSESMINVKPSAEHTNDIRGLEPESGPKGFRFGMPNGQWSDSYKTIDEAKAEYEKVYAKEKIQSKVHSIELTPSMKSDILNKGQALFENEVIGAYGSENARKQAIEKTARIISEVAPSRSNSGRRASALRSASRAAKEFQKQGFVDHTGKSARTAQDVAELAAVFRSPYIEQFQIIYVKDGKVLAHNVLTSGQPNQISVSRLNKKNPSLARLAEKVNSAAKRLGADQVYFAHNHPRGDPNPSTEDILFTNNVKTMLSLPLAGHVVTNGDSFAIIGERSPGSRFRTSYEIIPYEKSKGNISRAEGATILKLPEIVAKEARGFVKDGRIAVIYINSANRTNAISLHKNTANLYEAIKQGFKANLAARYFVVYDENSRPDMNKLPAGMLDIIELSNGGYKSLNYGTLKIKSNVDEAEAQRLRSIQEEQSAYGKLSKEQAKEKLKNLSSKKSEVESLSKESAPKEQRKNPEDGLSAQERAKMEMDALSNYGGLRSIKQPTVTQIKAASSPQEFEKRIEQLNKFGQANAILRRTVKLRNASGRFSPSENTVKIDDTTYLNSSEYMMTLGHELGHAIEYNVTGKISQGTSGNTGFELFGKDADPEKIREELVAVSEDLVGIATMETKPGYYYQSTELIARFFEKMIFSPGNLRDLSPTAVDAIEKQSIKHPIIQEFLLAATGGIDKGTPKFAILRDMRETYQKYLGKFVGNRAYDQEMVYRAMKERGKIVLEKFINDKMKMVKDSPESLFRAAESIKISRGGKPEFGTKNYAVAKTPEEENNLILSGYEKTPMLVLEDGIAYPQYAKQRYTPEEAKQIFDSLSDNGKKLITDFTATRKEAKDFFNREVIKETYGIKSKLEGWVHHYFEDQPGSTVIGGQKFKRKVAGSRKQRTGSEGYVEDFKKAMTKALVDLEGEKVFNEFIPNLLATVTKPLGEGQAPDHGWIEVVGNIKTGVGLPIEKRATIIENGKSFPLKQSRYQMPKEIYERYKMWRGLIDEATTAVRIVNDLNRYWRINILTHPGTSATNFISGGIQYSAKILTDFYREVLTGNLTMPETQNNISAMLKVLLPKGWMDAPDWVYGSDLSNFYGEFMKKKSPVSESIDAYGNKALVLFGVVERYWKKVIMTADGVADLKSLSEMNPEGLRVPTKEEEQLIADLNSAVDLYAYDYDNVPVWLEAHQKNVLGQAIKPFAKYPYKYAKQILNMVGEAFDQSIPVKDRISKILALATLVASYAAIANNRRKEQKTPVADKSLDIPARLQTRGRIFITTDNKGRELFIRVGKYPFFNLTEAGMQFVDGNWETGKDVVSDMLGSLGPAASIGLMAFNYRNKYQQYEKPEVILGDNLATFLPGYRILNDVSRAFDPFQRRQETFAQTFTQIIPTTDEALQEKLHGKIRTERVPIEGDVGLKAKGRRTTVDVPLENVKEDILLSLFTGVYRTRLDPKVVEAYIIRKEKNLDKKEAREERKK